MCLPVQPCTYPPAETKPRQRDARKRRAARTGASLQPGIYRSDQPRIRRYSETFSGSVGDCQGTPQVLHGQCAFQQQGRLVQSCR
jgi:hypothetical protein